MARSTLKHELAALNTAPTQILRERYHILFKRPPPPAFEHDVLRWSVAFRLQEIAFGTLARKTKKRLDILVAQYKRDPTIKLTGIRRAIPAVTFTRTWKGHAYRVTVVDGGFHYAGKTYRSLSAIARLITGGRWNGPRFFGLRNRRRLPHEATDA